MRKPSTILRSFILLLGVALIASSPSANAQKGPASMPKPRLIVLSPSAAESTDIFKGPPQTVTMRSGMMVLAPSKSVGKHSTHTFEEAVIVLAGTGEMRIAGGPTFRLKPYCVAYCPPATEHDVINTGSETLRYIWLVAKASP
jgi:mannose-6-phosphate isomerase-like protein (cupin superfamily)